MGERLAASDSASVGEARLDRWLWAVRLYKTRQEAVEACRAGRVRIDDQPAKPSRMVRPGQIIRVRRDGVDWQYRVLRPIIKRVGPKDAVTCREDLTPQDQLDRWAMIRSGTAPFRPPGAGRPTKKDRRDLEEFFSASDDVAFDA